VATVPSNAAASSAAPAVKCHITTSVAIITPRAEDTALPARAPPPAAPVALSHTLPPRIVGPHSQAGKRRRDSTGCSPPAVVDLTASDSDGNDGRAAADIRGDDRSGDEANSGDGSDGAVDEDAAVSSEGESAAGCDSPVHPGHEIHRRRKRVRGESTPGAGRETALSVSAGEQPSGHSDSHTACISAPAAATEPDGHEGTPITRAVAASAAVPADSKVLGTVDSIPHSPHRAQATTAPCGGGALSPVTEMGENEPARGSDVVAAGGHDGSTGADGEGWDPGSGAIACPVCGGFGVEMADDVRDLLATLASGDCRATLNYLEVGLRSERVGKSGESGRRKGNQPSLHHDHSVPHVQRLVSATPLSTSSPSSGA